MVSAGPDLDCAKVPLSGGGPKTAQEDCIPDGDPWLDGAELPAAALQ